MKTILIATNFSDGAKNAAKFAVQLFRNGNVKYILLNTYYDPPATYDIVTAPDGALEKESLKNLEEEKQWLSDQFPDWRLDIETRSVYGMLLSGINDAVEEYIPDFVAISNRVKFDIDTVIMRRKTADIVNKINCPVLSVPDTVPYGDVGKMAFASDMKLVKDTSLLDPIVSLLKNHGSKLNIFYVNTKTTNGIEFKNSPVGIQLGGYFAGVQHSFDVYKNPDVGAGLAEYTKRLECGVLVVIERKHNFFERLFESSISREVSELSQVPLIILHEN